MAGLFFKMWNKRHDEFSLHCGIRPSSEKLLRWILRRAKLNEISEIEIDLKIFNKWVAKKRGKPFDRKTLREAISQLETQTRGMVCILKKYTPYIYKIVVRPLHFLPQEEEPNSGKNSQPGNAKAVSDKAERDRRLKQQQQDISRVDQLVSEVGLKYDADALRRIWILAGKNLGEVRRAIELMLYRHSEGHISKPHGFLIDCLKRKWQEGFDIYYEPELPRFTSRSQLVEFCSNVTYSHTNSKKKKKVLIA